MVLSLAKYLGSPRSDVIYIPNPIELLVGFEIIPFISWAKLGNNGRAICQSYISSCECSLEDSLMPLVRNYVIHYNSFIEAALICNKRKCNFMPLQSGSRIYRQSKKYCTVPTLLLSIRE